MWANFERFLRDYLEQKGTVLHSQVSPPDLGAVLYRHYCKEAEHWKPDEILDFLKGSVFNAHQNLIEQAKSIYKHRNWVAHGKKPGAGKASGRVDPVYVYKTLDEIIEMLLIN